MSDFDKHLEKFRIDDLAVLKGERWTVVVRQKQITIGSVVLLLRRAEPSLGGVSPEESSELFQLVGEMQERLSTRFGAQRFNLIAAMMKDPWVHFHLIPRFNVDVECNGKSWTDLDWPGVATFHDVATSEDDLQSVRDALRDDDSLGE